MFGVVSGGAQMMMTLGYRFAPAAIVAPFDYSALVWAALLGFVLWGDVPTAWVVGGAAIVIGSGLYILRRETKLARERVAAGAAIRPPAGALPETGPRSEEHTSELQSLMRKSYAVFCLKNKKNKTRTGKKTN